MGKIGAGVIGLRMGASHTQAYVNNQHTELRAVCDLNLPLAEKVARDYRVAFFTSDYREVLARDDIEIVSIATPDHFHAEHSIAALEAGKHILCEKPLALTISDVESMVSAADRSGKKFMVGQVCRYAPGFSLAKRLVDKGEIGELFFVESEYAHNYAGSPGVGGWRKDPKIGREPFVGGACHAVDLIRWLAGDAEEAFAYANHKCLTDWPGDDCTIAIFKFSRNVVGKVFSSIGCRRPYTMRSVFYGTKGTIVCDNTSPSIQLYTDNLPELSGFVELPVSLASHNVSLEINELVSAILENRPVQTDVREGAKTVATCLAAVESAAKDVPVKIRNEF